MKYILPVVQILLLLTLCCNALTQTTEERIVKGKKVFICTMSDRDTFQTAAEGCKHWAGKHLDAGYTYKEGSAKVEPNGAVFCLCTKPGQSDNDQQGMIMGIILCPENASELNIEPQKFEDRKCQCYETYVAHGEKCYKPEDVPKDSVLAKPPTKDEPPLNACEMQLGLTQEQAALKKQVSTRLQEIVNRINREFANDPTIAAHPDIFSPKELAHYGEGFYKKYLWYQGYGHAIERLTYKAMKNDPFLSSNLQYIPNAEQIGGNPDFKGKGKLPSSVSFDITTPEQVASKKTKGKECWDFITYKRLIDEKGNKVPFK
jgi:hypothetical protein